jgi:hypothetical protein
MEMYKELEIELKATKGEDFSLINELASEAMVQYTQVKSIFDQPIMLREIIDFLAFKKSKMTAAQWMARKEKYVQKALEEKLKEKLAKFQKKK